MTFLRGLALSFVFLVLSTSTRAANAQVSVYGTAGITAYGFSDDGGNEYSFKNTGGGFIAGMFYNFPLESRLTAGVDLRASYSPGSNGGTFETASFRLGIVPHKVPLRPYFALGGGVVSSTGSFYAGFVNSNVIYQTSRVTNGAVDIHFGLDVPVSKSFDVRVFDYGAVIGASKNNSVGAGFLDAGVVYHFHPKKPKP